MEGGGDIRQLDKENTSKLVPCTLCQGECVKQDRFTVHIFIKWNKNWTLGYSYIVDGAVNKIRSSSENNKLHFHPSLLLQFHKSKEPKNGVHEGCANTMHPLLVLDIPLP